MYRLEIEFKKEVLILDVEQEVEEIFNLTFELFPFHAEIVTCYSIDDEQHVDLMRELRKEQKKKQIIYLGKFKNLEDVKKVLEKYQTKRNEENEIFI